jgi:hypothetical protein
MKIQNILFFIIFISLFSCRTFIHGDGSKSRSFYLVKDGYKKVAQEDLDKYLYQFNIDNIGKKLTLQEPSDVYFEEMRAENIQEIAQKNKATLLVIWYPNCGSILQAVVDVLNKGLNNYENPDFELVLLSTSYKIPDAQNNLFMIKYKILSYVLSHEYGKTLIDKKINLGKDLCPSCYEVNKDDINDLYVYLLDKNAKVNSVHYTIYQKDLKRSIFSDMDKLDERIKDLLENE